MNFIRTCLSSANEALLFLGVAMTIGYFGSRGMLGSFPGFLAVIMVMIGVGFSISIAISQSTGSSDDEYGQSRPWLDKAIWYSVLFLSSLSLFVYLGTIS